MYETASVGSVVLKALAVDHDKGDNAKITYSIISGNVGNVFNIDPNLGMCYIKATKCEFVMLISQVR